MSISVDALRAELRKLRQRRAVRGPQLLMPYPELTAACGIAEHDTPDQRRRKLTNVIEQLLSAHPEWQELLLVALGLHDRARQDTLERRLAWLKNERRESVETLRRQLDKAIEQFALAASAAPRTWSAPSDVGYAVEALETTLTIGGEHASFFQRRKISAVQHGLRELRCWVQVASPPAGESEPSFTFRGADGALEDYDRHRSGDVLECRIRLPRALSAGEVYELEVSFTLPASRLEPFQVVQPSTPFGSIDVNVVFDPRRVPSTVWRVDGVMAWALDSDPPADKLLRPDPSGRVRATFVCTREGRTYGLAWRW